MEDCLLLWLHKELKHQWIVVMWVFIPSCYLVNRQLVYLINLIMQRRFFFLSKCKQQCMLANSVTAYCGFAVLFLFYSYESGFVALLFLFYFFQGVNECDHIQNWIPINTCFSWSLMICDNWCACVIFDLVFTKTFSVSI